MEPDKAPTKHDIEAVLNEMSESIIATRSVIEKLLEKYVALRWHCFIDV
jgi:hypothetical protein